MMKCPQLILITLMISFLHVRAQGAEFRRGEEINVSGPFTESLFIAGGRVTADLDASDDVFIAGREITQSGGTKENIFIAGRNIVLRGPKARMSIIAGATLTIQGAEFRDLILAANSVHLQEAHIVDDAILAGRRIDVDKDSRIDDSVILAGNDVLFAGQAGGDVEIRGDVVTITGLFNKNLSVRANRLVIGPDARIQGDLLHSVRSLEIAPGAKIGGRNQVLLPSLAAERATAMPGWAIAIWFLIMFGSFIAPALVAALFPKFVSGGTEIIRAHFGETVGTGAIVAIVAPILLTLLFVSIVGIPMGLFAVPFILVAAVFAWTIALATIGFFVRSWFVRRQTTEGERVVSIVPLVDRVSLFLWTLAGSFVLWLVLWVPVIGFLVGLSLFLAGFGAAFLQLFGRTARPASPPEVRPERRLVPADTHA